MAMRVELDRESLDPGVVPARMCARQPNTYKPPASQRAAHNNNHSLLDAGLPNLASLASLAPQLPPLTMLSD